MDEIEDWDIEDEFRTKFESEEHWTLKKDFITAHKDRFPKQRLICLAQVFANIQLLRCKYPDTLMRQVAELGKGIGKDYKTKQKERLQRTFVKASDAANAKVLGLKRRKPLDSQDGPPSKKISFIKESSTDDAKIKQRNQEETAEVSCVKYKFMNKTDKSNVNEETSSVKLNKYAKALKKETKNEKVPFNSPKIAAIINKKSTPNLPEKSASKLDVNSEDSLISNLFIVYTNFLGFSSYYNILKNSTDFCHYRLIDNFHVNKRTGESVCTLSVQINDDTQTLGSGEHAIQKVSREEAAKETLTNLLERCSVIEIKERFKKRVSGTKEVNFDNLVRRPEGQKISNDNVGAKMLKLMGWSGGALGKTSQGIVEPVKERGIVGRQGLGIKDELRPTPQFQENVKELLNEMVMTLRTQPETVLPDLIFSSDLSNEQRRYIHKLIRKEYRLLKSVIYGHDDARFLSVKQDWNSMELFQINFNLQGGLTDKFTIHKPGTLSFKKITKKIAKKEKEKEKQTEKQKEKEKKKQEKTNKKNKKQKNKKTKKRQKLRKKKQMEIS